MSISNNTKKYYTFCKGLRSFIKKTISLEESKEIIKRRAERREQLFLNILEKAIFDNINSPYLKLFNLAGYKFDDIEDLVKNCGVEQTLSRLVNDGIYLTFDEFKGRKQVMRSGKIFAFKESDFDNPFLLSYLNVETGGTSSPGTRTMIDFGFLSQEACHRALVLDIHGLFDAPCILWFPILPGNAGIMNVLRQAKINKSPIKWFSQVDKRSVKPSLTDRFGTNFIVYIGRLLGGRIPAPEYVDLKDAHKIAQCLIQILQEHSKCSVFTYVNSAVRISMAAKHKDIDLKGVSFFVAGEPITDTKLKEIKSSGADAIPYYAFAEGGIVAYGCAHPDVPDDMHILRDHTAVISYKKKPKYSNDIIDALLFTSLLPESPKTLLNVETGDYGLIRSSKCNCEFEAYKFSEHISNIKSFEKFTSEGMTFMVDDLVHIAEDILPAKYGGSSADYQVLEEYNDNGLTSLYFVISPRIGPVNESDFTKTVMQELRKNEYSKRLMAEIWSKAGTIKIRRMDPLPTKRGKIFSFRNIHN